MSAVEEEKATDISNPDVVTKYRTSGDIAKNALNAVLTLCVEGAKIVDICDAGDAFITEATSKIYKGKKIEKGIGFPTCVSVNHIVGHFSPPKDDNTVLKNGDLCKIDLGVHVDGYTAMLAHSFVLGGPAEGKAGDLLAAIYTAGELAKRMIKVNRKNTEITDMIAKVADEFKVNAVHGVLSHQMEQNSIAGEKSIICKADVDENVAETEFEVNEVYAVDIVMSTGEGKPKEGDTRTTVFKRQPDEKYMLKRQASRVVFGEVQKDFKDFPFSLRSIKSSNARFGINECVEHKLLAPFPVLLEKEGDLVAHLKFTALLLPNGTVCVTDAVLTPEMFKTDKALTDLELLKTMMTSAGGKKKKNKKKKKKATESKAE